MSKKAKALEDRLVFQAGEAAKAASGLCATLWHSNGDMTPAQAQGLTDELVRAATRLQCAALTLQLFTHGVKRPKLGD